MGNRFIIAGVDRTKDILFTQNQRLTIEQQLGHEDDCRFVIKSGDRPLEGEEILIYADGTKLFAGIIDEVHDLTLAAAGPHIHYSCKARDYTYQLNQRLVVESYTDMTADAIVRDILTKYCPDFSDAYVQAAAPVVEWITFDYKLPSECFRELCDYVGWYWFVDYDKNVHFLNPQEFPQPAPMIIEPGGKYRNFRRSIDIVGLRNRVYVRGGTMLSDPQVVQWKADGVARIWTLPWGPHEVDFKVGEVAKTVGVENLHEEIDFDYMMSFTEKYIRCSSNTSTPAAGTTMSLTARQDIPVITMTEDYASQAAIAKVQGGDGIYEHVISDDSLTSIAAAEAAGMSDLREHANPRVKGSFETEYAVPPVPVEKLVLDYAAKTKTDWEAGILNDVEATDNGLVLESATAPTFTRDSKAYLSDGTEVDAGVARFEAGQFGQAVLVEEGTANLCTNPSFETDLTGWGAHLGGGTSSRVTDQKYYGNACLKISTTDTENTAERWYAVANPGNYAGKTVSLSCMVKTSIADKLRLRIREHDGNNYKWSNSSYHPGDGTWKKLSLTTTLRSTVTDLRLQLLAGAGIIGDFWCDGVLFEEKPYPTSFTPGTRSPETLTIPTGVMKDNEGTIMLWAKKNDFQVIRSRKILDAENPRIDWQWNGYGNYSINFGGASLSVLDPAQDTGWHFYAVTYSGRTVKLYFDGLLVASGQATQDLKSFTTLYLGTRYALSGGWNTADATFDDLRISSRARTDQEIADAYTSEEPLPVDEWTTYKLGFDGDLTVGKGGMMESSILTPALREGETTGSLVNWEDVVPAGADIKIKTSVSTDGGLTWNEWEEAEEDSPIPGITEGMDLAGLQLKYRAILITEDTGNPLRLSSLFLNIMAEVLESRNWQPGQIVEINLPDRGIQGEYLIQRVTTSPLTPKLWTFRVEYGGRLFGIADFLQALVSAQQKRRHIEPTKNVQKYIYGEETLELSDELIAASRALPFICGDADAICGMVVVSDG